MMSSSDSTDPEYEKACYHPTARAMNASLKLGCMEKGITEGIWDVATGSR